MLSHPVLADLIEQEFVPCVINNRGDRGSLGENDATLQLFSEPMLNNPVVRFVDSTGEVSAAVQSPRFQRVEALLICTGFVFVLGRQLRQDCRTNGHRQLSSGASTPR